MDKISAAAILRDFESNRQIAASGEDRRWRFTPGTLLFPEGRCCYCGEAVRSNRIWLVDTDNDGRLRGQLNVSGTTAKFERPYHPHAGTDGSLCTGGHDVLTAMFFGVNPADTLRWRDERESIGEHIREWYSEMFGHKCGEAGLKAADGLFTARTRRSADRPPNCPCGCGCNPAVGECGCGCDSCECDEESETYICWGCESEVGENDYFFSSTDHRRYCRGCYYERYQECHWCNREFAANEVIRDDEVAWCREHSTPEGRRPRTTLTATAAWGPGTGWTPTGWTLQAEPPELVWEPPPPADLSAPVDETERSQIDRQMLEDLARRLGRTVLSHNRGTEGEGNG